MTLSATLLSILVGACWLASATHLFAAIRRSFSLTHLTFAVFAFASGGQSLAFAGAHHALDVGQYVEAMRWAFTAGTVGATALLWFARFYTRSADRVVPALLSVMQLVVLAMNLYLPYGLAFDDPPTLERIVLPWNELATVHAVGDFSPRMLLLSLFALSLAGYVYFACIRQYRRGERTPALALSTGMSIVLLSIAINVAGEFAGIHSSHQMQRVADELVSFGFVVLVLLMMYWLSSEESFRTVVAEASEGIFIADQRGCYIDVNAAGCELLGWSVDELRRMHVLDIVAPQDVDRLAEQRSVLSSGGVMRGLWNFRRKNGTQFTGELSSRRLPDGRILSLLRDVTAQQEFLRSLEDRVAARTAEYAELNRQLEAFAYSVSHDLRAPVRAIAGFTGMLLREHATRLQPEAQHLLDRVAAAASHMNELIEGLLQLANVSHRALSMESVDLSALVNGIIRSLREREPHRSIAIDCAELPSVRGDPPLLSIVMTNLLENAWKYTSRREQARIEIGYDTVGDQLVFYVKDNGAGFDMQFAEQLFEPFHRLHSAKDFPGTGIGLATVARIVERHGGRIWADSQVNRGATFYFTLGRRNQKNSDKSFALQGTAAM